MYNLAFRECIFKDYKKESNKKKLPPSNPLTNHLYVE